MMEMKPINNQIEMIVYELNEEARKADKHNFFNIIKGFKLMNGER